MSIHVQHVHGPAMITSCSAAVISDGRPIALCFGVGAHMVADRIAVLLDQHGLYDVPDTPEACCPWPPPSGPPASRP